MKSGVRWGNFVFTTSMMIWLILIIASFGGLFISTFHASNFVYYCADALNILLLFFTCKKIKKVHSIMEIRPLIILFWLYVISTMIGIIGNEVPIVLALWGLRNVFRFIVFFIACVILLEREDILTFDSIIPKIYYLNAALVIIQYFVLGLKGDYVGGIFGTLQGCNISLTIFLNIFLAYFISKYLYGLIKIWNLGIYIVIYFLIASLSETKGNYVFFILIIAVAIIVIKKSLKTFSITILAVLALVLGAYLLNRYFPGSLDFLLDWSEANAYMDASYFGTETFTRNATLSTANKLFFKDNLWLYLFGYGMGACDTSNYFQSPFFQNYGYMNYRQYGSSMTVLQNGYVGLFLYFMFFLIIFIISLRKGSKIVDRHAKAIMSATCCIAVFAIVDSFYASLYIDAAYCLYFTLAIPFILIKSDSQPNTLYANK